MKKIMILLMFVLLIAGACIAMEKNMVVTGDKDTDLALKTIDSRVQTPSGANDVKDEMRTKLSLTDREIKFLSKQGYTMAQIYYLASLAKESGKTVDSVAALHSQGIGWGILAQRLGVRPDALRKLIVAQKKEMKKEMKEEKKDEMKEEKKMMREERPMKSPMMEKREKMMPGGGMQRGKSRGN